MTSLEFIEKEIKKRIDNISAWGKLLKDDPNDKFSARCLNKYKEELEVLFKIKSELEAWEVCKKHYHINKYEDINKGRDKKRFDITIWLNTENCDFKSCASYEECLKVKNALEVEE